MRTDCSDPDALQVENRPLFVPAFCLVFVVVGAHSLVDCMRTGSWSSNDVAGIVISLVLGTAGFLYTARRDSYRFDRRTGKLQWTRRSLVGRDAGWLPLAEIERVVVQKGPDWDSTTYRIVLYTTNHGVLPLTNDYTSGEPHFQEVAGLIEGVLTEPEVARSA